jgi:hypothetical protein
VIPLFQVMHLLVFFIIGGESMNKTQDFTKGVIWKQLLFFFFPILCAVSIKNLDASSMVKGGSNS